MCPGECNSGCSTHHQSCLCVLLVLISTLFKTPDSLLVHAAVSARNDVRCMQLSSGECTQVSR